MLEPLTLYVSERYGASYAAFVADRESLLWRYILIFVRLLIGDLLYKGAKDTISFLTANNVPAGEDMNLADTGSGPEGLVLEKVIERRYPYGLEHFLKVKVKNTKSFLIIMTISR